jgi:hypothetical protein
VQIQEKQPDSSNKDQPQRMATPSAKHLSFVATPLQDTKLKDLPGIGETYEKKLREANINNPKMLMGQYLVQAGWHECGGDACCIDASLFHAVGWRNIACQKPGRAYPRDIVIH